MSEPSESPGWPSKVEGDPAKARLAVVTGGAACGKSTAINGLKKLLPDAAWFDSDGCVHRLLTQPGVGDTLREVFGEKIFADDKQVNRANLRRLILSNPDLRASLEALLHPLVAQELIQQLETLSGGWLLAEVPLLHETASKIPADLIIAIVASPATQNHRLAKRGLAPEEIEALLAAQWPVPRKMSHSDVCLWNDGSEAALEAQIQILISRFAPD